ncbi:MAG: tyrosine-type recombinase/integrase [Verrucomicrobiota bacterium]
MEDSIEVTEDRIELPEPYASGPKLLDQAWSLEPDHRTLGCETIRASSELPALPKTDAEIDRIIEALRRAIRIAGLACATEDTYLNWNIRYTRFCLECLKRTPRDAGPVGMTAYLNYLALERNVGPATQKQALNAMVFLTRRVFGIADFTIETPSHGYAQRHPPVLLSRREVAAILAHLKEHLAKAREKHLRDLAGSAREAHMPEGLLCKWPQASQEWEWQYVFAAATSCPHPRTGRVARHHLNEFSMQRQFKNAVNKANIARHVTPQCLRNSFATHLLQSGTDVRTVQDLLGHASVETTMIYLPTLKRPGTAAVSPLDMP